MTISDARKRARRDAVLYTTAIISAIGAYSYYNSK